MQLPKNINKLFLLTMKAIICFIINDEPLARKGIEEYVNETDLISVVGKAENPVKALPVISQNKVDLIFLDALLTRIL